jgi:hypothetical protein
MTVDDVPYPRPAPLKIAKRVVVPTKSKTPTEARPKSPIQISRTYSLRSGLKRLLSPTEPKTPLISEPPRRRRKATPGGYYQAVDDMATLKQLVLEDKKFYQLLLEYSQSEYSSETVQFLAEFWSYKKLTNKKQKLERFKHIFTKYIKDGCTLQVNLPGCVVELVNSFMSFGAGIPFDVEELLEDSLLASFQDIYRRFEESNRFVEIKVC